MTLGKKLFWSRVFCELLVDSPLVKISLLVQKLFEKTNNCAQFIISNTEECRTICYSWSLGGYAVIFIDYVAIWCFSPGPNSPLLWMQLCVETLAPDAQSDNRRKILLGLNFYGNDYVPGGGGPIVRHESVLQLSLSFY